MYSVRSMSQPVAYLRRSRVDARREGAISHEQQLQAVRRLAEEHGDNPDQLIVIEDWGKSGRAERQHLRSGFARLEKMVNAGEASAIYSYSASRLARSLEALARLAKVCETADVPIRCADGYSPDVTTSTGRMVLGILGSVYAWQAEWTQERANEVSAVRRIRGDHMGPAPYGFRVVGGQLVDNPDEHLGDVLDAFRETRSYQGAARLLTTRGVRPRRGKHWAASAVRDMLRRQAPELIPATMTKGRRPGQHFRLSGLLRCPCGALLTGRHFRGKYVSYECRRAREDPYHPRPACISELKIMDWIQSEARRLRMPSSVAMEGGDAGHALLEDRRRRVIDNYEDGLIDKVERDRKLTAIGDQLSRLSAGEIIATIPRIDWAWSPEVLNSSLRALWDHVELDADLRPARAVWTVPEWRG